MRLFQPLLTHFCVQDLTNILNDEITFSNVVMSLQPPSSGTRIEQVGVGILALHHPLVLAGIPNGAGIRATLKVAGPVYTNGIFIAWVFGSALTGNGVAIVILVRPRYEVLVALVEEECDSSNTPQLSDTHEYLHVQKTQELL